MGPSSSKTMKESVLSTTTFTNQQRRARRVRLTGVTRKDGDSGSGTPCTAHQQLALSHEDHSTTVLPTTADNTPHSTLLCVSSDTCCGCDVAEAEHNFTSHGFDSEGGGKNMFSADKTSAEFEENQGTYQDNSVSTGDSFVAKMAVELEASILPKNIQADESVNYLPSNGDFEEQEDKSISQENCASPEDNLLSELTGKVEKSVALKDTIEEVESLLSNDISAENDQENGVSTEDSSFVEMATELEDTDGGTEDYFPTSTDEDHGSRPLPVNCASSEKGFVAERATSVDDISEGEVEDYLPTGDISAKAGVQALSREKYESSGDVNSEGSNSAKDILLADGETPAVSYENEIAADYSFSAEWADTEKQEVVYTLTYGTAYDRDDGDSALQDKTDNDEGSPSSSDTEDMYDAEEEDNDVTDESTSQDGLNEDKALHGVSDYKAVCDVFEDSMLDEAHGDDDSDDIIDEEELGYVTDDEDLDNFHGDEEWGGFRSGEASDDYPIRDHLDNDVKVLDDKHTDQETNNIPADNVKSYAESNLSKYNSPCAEDRTDGNESHAAEIEDISSILERKNSVSRGSRLPEIIRNRVKTSVSSQISDNSSSEYMCSNTEDWLSTADDAVNSERSAWEDAVVSYSNVRSNGEFLESAYRNCTGNDASVSETHVHVTIKSHDDDVWSCTFLGDTLNSITEDSVDFRNENCKSVFNDETRSKVYSSQAGKQTDESVLIEDTHSKVCSSQAIEQTDKFFKENIQNTHSKPCSSNAAVQTDVLPRVNIDDDFEKAKQFVCDKCGSCYSRADHLLAHQQEHPIRTQRLGIRCGGCGAAFISYNSLVYHLHLNRAPNLGFRCHCCRRWFPVCDDLFRHKQTKRLQRDNEIGRMFLDPTGLFLARKSC